jgi:hypothetical protein
MAWGIGAVLAGLVLGGLAMARSHPRAQFPERLVPAYGWKGRPYEDGDYPSPDRRYLARTRTGEAAVVTLTIIDTRTHEHLAQVEDLNSFVWVPRHGHRLVVAASGVYAKALLGLWDDGSHWRSLHRVRRPDDEDFTLYGATSDGRLIVYGHTTDLDKDPTGLDQRRWLQLPPGN